jgi:hypothetical protein
MTSDTDSTRGPFGPWNPGVRSPVPEKLRQYCTVFLPANVFTPFSKASELHDLTGLEMGELVAFRPQRLVLHELLIRVTADLSVPDGERIEDLGINFREMTRAILARHIEPNMNAIVASFDGMRRDLARVIEDELATVLETHAAPQGARTPRGGFTIFSRFGVAGKGTAAPRAARSWDEAVPAELGVRAQATDDALRKAALRALARVMSALLKRHGAPWGTRELITSIAMDLASNDVGSDLVGSTIEPHLREAVQSLGYRLLPPQEWPVIMNTKGPSASGKSTLRPLQKQLAGRVGVKWRDFALISPDIWRKQLLDYDALGFAHKYAGSFTGEEVQIIDQKLDRHMARKAERGPISHLLIDRFRFDSFAPDSDEAGSNLLTRFGRIIYLFFMITPPESLVERAWNRGLDFGRYKAVDDTLAHGVEAYSGMPQLFFTWVKRADKRVHFEFLDNTVRRGERPRTVAFGGNETLNVLDVKCLLNIERYRRANINATTAACLYADHSVLAPESNLAFFRQCMDRFRYVNFAEQTSGRVYLSLIMGKPVWADRNLLDEAVASADTHAALLATAPSVFDYAAPLSEDPRFLKDIVDPQQLQTLGRWGS